MSKVELFDYGDSRVYLAHELYDMSNMRVNKVNGQIMEYNKQIGVYIGLPANIEYFFKKYKVESIDYIHIFTVDKSSRETGVGSRALKEFIDKSNGEMIELTASPISNKSVDIRKVDAKRLIKFYSTLGFNIEETMKSELATEMYLFKTAS